MDDKNIVIITGNFFFPNKNAAGKYNLAYGLMLRDMGYRVVFIGTNKDINYDVDILDTLEKAYDMECYSMPYPNKLTDWGKYKSQFNRVLRVINYLGKENIRTVIGFGSPSIAIWVKLLWKWSKKNDIKYIAHCAENVRFTKRNFIYSIIRGIDEIYNKRIIIPKADGVIVGGPLLKEYFDKRQCKTIVFPTLTDTEIYDKEVQDVLCSKLYEEDNQVRKKRFIYVGIPFDIKSKNKKENFKDRLDKTIELFYQVSKVENRFILDIYGLTENEYLLHVPEHKDILEALRGNISFHGRIEHKVATRKIISSDFYVFHRDKTNITEAAFPTKASEPITLGVPVITNDTSYIFHYISDTSTGFKIDEVNQIEVVLKLINLSNAEVLKLRTNCLNDKSFDYRKYIPKFKRFIENMY